MFFQRKYVSPPPEWSRRALTYWDCGQFALVDSPTIAWVVTGDVDITRLSNTLEKAVKRRAPWMRGRLARTESGSPLYEIHVPPENSDVTACSVSTSEIDDPLDSVISYTPNGTSQPSIRILERYDPTIINPRNAKCGAEDCVNNNYPLLHLHFITASDATLVSLAWNHVPMDASGCAQIVAIWEEELNGIETDTVYEDVDPEKIFDFTDDIPLEPGLPLPGWIQPSWLDYVKLAPSHLYSMYTDPAVDGTIYLPRALVEHWKRESEKELPAGEWVSRNDLVEAWLYKYGWSHHHPSTPITMFCAMCFRGKHPSLPRTLITNTAMSYVIPTHTSSTLQSTSLAQLAHKIRLATTPFHNPSHVAEVVAYEYRNVKSTNGKGPYLPLGVPRGKHLGAISWAKLGLSRVRFGGGLETRACLTYNAGRRCATVIDSEGGDWRVDLRLGRKTWEVLRVQVEEERKKIEAE